MAGEKKKALTRLPLILLLVIIAIVVLTTYWLYQDHIGSSGRLYSSKSKMCEQFAKSYLRTIKEVKDIDDLGGDVWLKVVDIETEIHKLCQLELTEEAIKNYQATALEKYSTDSTNERSSINFWLCEEDPQYLGIFEDEVSKIEKVIDDFEGLKYQVNSVAAIKMISPPQTEMEEWWFNHLSGNDALRVSSKPFPRFLNKVNFHMTLGYDVEKITKKEGIFYAHIKELRVTNVAYEGTMSEYVTDVQDLTFELVENNEDYQISRYYHTNPTTLVDLKYEGFTY